MARKIKVLTQKNIDKRITDLSEWKLNAKCTQISKTFTFPSFITALAFCAKITVHAEVLQHHPELELSYGKVKVKLTTHDAKGLTKSDFDLAKRIEGMRLS